MNANVLVAAPLRRAFLGAEELLELGQVQRTPAPPATTVAPPALGPGSRTVALSRDEGQLIIRVVENIIAFKDSYPIEFLSYCPPDRWQASATQVVTWTRQIERQLKEGSQVVVVPADALLRLVDLEKCISAARDARLGSAKLAFYFSAGGAIADIVFGLSWISIPCYIAGLAILLGRPLVAKLKPEPEEPYKPALTGGQDECHVAIGDHTDKNKILERVVVAGGAAVQRYHWGEVHPAFGPVQAAVCLSKDRFRVRVEGWLEDTVIVNDGWERAPLSECEVRKQIAVWSPCGAEPRNTPHGPIPRDSGHPETYWIEYVGPLTDGLCRVAGPFG
jgi:hypothetical protein